MTIKHDCEMCQGEGIIIKIISNPIDWGRTPAREIFEAPMYEKVKDYCECVWGRRAKETDERMSRPDYVNPLESMTDEQILRAIDHATDNQKAIDKEFNL